MIWRLATTKRSEVIHRDVSRVLGLTKDKKLCATPEPVKVAQAQMDQLWALSQVETMIDKCFPSLPCPPTELKAGRGSKIRAQRGRGYRCPSGGHRDCRTRHLAASLEGPPEGLLSDCPLLHRQPQTQTLHYLTAPGTAM